ncbi:PREDICTED: F-box protein At2g16450-like [Camelina sativa]|uniref:F-box protein At2g16450-like n=1 Tax=Camelina sativa TaxID=90675 RepID=A0ABM0YDT8_CAMSA|nr:PREDICTED: F-box protein At2g16450-like [Camelina sativa]
MMKSSPPMSIELILEIISRLPGDAVARFRCVSKQWASMLATPYFKELFLTNSSSKPRLLFAIADDGNHKGRGEWCFFSSPQLEDPYEKSSSSTLVSAAEFHVKKFSPEEIEIDHYSNIKYFSCGYNSGLIYFHGSRYQGKPVICNPNTGRYAVLPYMYTYRKAFSFFGFDPIDKQYKVLYMAYASGPGHHYILTFGAAADMSWRKIKCPLRHEIRSDGVCINGVVYYLGDTRDPWDNINGATLSDYVIVCFHVRSEKFSFIHVERFCRLINFKGKLAMIYWEDDFDIYEAATSDLDVDQYLDDDLVADANYELHVWVLEDVAKQDWSKHTYTWSTDKVFFRRHVYIAGATASGEIVFSMRKYTSKKPFYVFYFNPERNILQRVEVQGFGEGFKNPCSVRTFVNHVEDLHVNDFELLKPFHAPFEDPELLDSDSDSDREGRDKGKKTGMIHWSLV